MNEDVLDTAPCGYFSYSDEDIITSINQTCCNWLGYEKKELESKKLDVIFTLPTRIFYQTHFFPLLKMQGHAEEIFLSLLAKDGSHLPILLNAKKNDSSTAWSFIIVPNRKKFEDELVAARKQAETALRENTSLLHAKAELQRHAETLDRQIQLVNKQNHELNQLNHVITHSLKEPLRKILLYTEKLEMNGTAEDSAYALGRLNTASVQMKQVVFGLQKYVWLNDVPAKFSRVNLSELLQHAAEQIRKETGPIKLELDLDGLPSIYGDRQQLELLFYHILSNAEKFKQGDEAEVTARSSIVQHNRFRAVEGKYQYDDFVRIDISDKGIGFDNSQATLVFDLFKKLHATTGTGLGLALCKKIVENHSGFIKAEGRTGKGATITITLPLRQSFEDRTGDVSE